MSNVDRQIDMAEAKRFLGMLFGAQREKHVEFRYLSSAGLEARQQFVAPAEEWPWREIQAAQNDGRNVYVGVCPRRVPKGDKGAVASVPALWVDIDAKHHGDSKDEALAALQRLDASLRPSIVVDSGNGYHAYWLLEEPVELEDPTSGDPEVGGEDPSYVEGLNLGLAHHVGGDHVQDVTRIMRMPGTWNLKDPDNPRYCALVEFEPDRRYPLEAFAHLFVQSSSMRQTVKSEDLPVTDTEPPDGLQLNGEATALWHGDLSSVEGDRSRALFRLGLVLTAHGLDERSVAAKLKALDTGLPAYRKYLGNDREYWRIAQKVGNSELRGQVTAAQRAGGGHGADLAAGTVRRLAIVRGRFLHDGEDGYYLADGILHLLHRDSDSLAAMLLDRYGVNRASRQFNYVLEALKTEALQGGDRVTPHRYAFYDRDRGALYLGDNAGGLYRIDEQAVARQQNGSDGIMFHPEPNVAPLTVESGGEDGLIDRLIFERAALEDGIVSAEHQRLLFKVWFFGLFFAEEMPTRMLLLLLGEKGSSKTTALNLVGRFLVGPAFSAGSVPRSQDDFDVIMYRNWLVALDNIDEHIPWLKDRLALAATGNTPRKRQLYTDRGEVAAPYRAFTALTSREPKFVRDDVADRMLVLRTRRIEQFQPSQLLYQEIDHARPQLWGEVVPVLQRIVGELRRLESDVGLNFRMADFARVGVAIARALDKEEEFREAMSTVPREQAHLLIEHDLTAQALIQWARENPERGEVTAAELYTDLSRSEGFSHACRNAVSLGQRLRHLQEDLKSAVRIKVLKHSETHAASYVIQPAVFSNTLAGTEEKRPENLKARASDMEGKEGGEHISF